MVGRFTESLSSLGRSENHLRSFGTQVFINVQHRAKPNCALEVLVDAHETRSRNADTGSSY